MSQIPPSPERNLYAMIDRVLENQNRGIMEMQTIRSRLHTLSNFLQAQDQRVMDVRDDIKSVMRTVENMHAENKQTLAILSSQVEELGECKALLEMIQLEGKLAQSFKDHLLAKETGTPNGPS